MPFKILKYGLLSIFTPLLFCMGILNVSAANYAKHEITLQSIGDQMVSETIFEEQTFNAVSVQVDKLTDDLMVNFGDGWRNISIHDDGFGPEALLFTAPTHTVQFKRTKTSNDTFQIKTHLFYYQSEENDPDTSDLQTANSQTLVKKFKVISRKQWGADEKIRYWNPDWDDNGTSGSWNRDPCAGITLSGSESNNIIRVRDTSPTGESLIWPIQYTKNVRKIVVHHTDSEIRDMNGDRRTDNRDYKTMLRAIYQYHTLSRGWGDIGYNYIIDPLGNVYEGRYGGDKVIAAHAQCYNNGSLGIAIIGDYEKKNIPEPALQSLISLVAQKSASFGIDPDGVGVFRGKKLPNVMGHKDVRPTSCPGRQLYESLPMIRQRAALALRSGAFKEGGLQVENLDYNAELTTKLSSLRLLPTQRESLRLRFRNTGKKAWDSNTWLHVALNNDPKARIVPVIEDKVFVAADMEEKKVLPGQSGTFVIEAEAGYFAGDYYFEVAPVVNGRYKVSRSSAFIHLDVAKPDFSYSVKSMNLPSGTIFQGQKVNATIDLKNTGNITWKNYGRNQITLGASAPRDRKSILVKENASRLGYLLESEVRPGETGRFVMNLDIPMDKTGRVTERFTPVIEYVNWLKDKDLGFNAVIKKPNHLARVKKVNKVNMLMPGEMVKVELELENRGDLAWDSDNMLTTLLGRGIKVFKSRLIPKEPIVPGKKGQFSFWVQAPYKEGRHTVLLRSKFNKTPIRGGAVRYVIQVPKPSLRAKLINQTNRNITMQPGEEKELMVQFENLGNTVWRNSGPNAVYLGNSRPPDRMSRLYYKKSWEGKHRPALLEEDEVKPGEIGTFIFKIQPQTKGVYNEDFQLVMERVGWMDGAYAKWSFRVFGDRVKGSYSSDNSDADQNKKRAALITKARSTTPIPIPKKTTVSPPKTSSTTKKVTTKTVTPIKTVKKQTDAEQPFRVRLSYGDTSSSLTANTPFRVTDGNGKQLFFLKAGEKILLRKINNNIHAQSGFVSKSASIVRCIPADGGIMEIQTMERRPTWNLKLNDNRFRGTIELRVVNGKAAYINELPLEDYLKGLAEVSNNSPLEKQKVIAVLARSYARHYMSRDNRKFPGLPYDGSDDPEIFQRYLGYGFELRSPNFLKASAATENEVVTYDGKLVKTPYFNQSNGVTLSAKELWGWTNTPYLKAVPDPWCEGMTRKGHGVGLSGYGATKQAEEGKGYKEIIKYYYDGVEVEELNFE